jgi:aspartate/methionine/tyrosine aminotransferase
MNFPQVKYMHWAKTTPVHYQYNLCASGINILATPEELKLSATDIQLTGDNFYGYPPLRAEISKWYNVPEKNIMITQGTSLANFLVAAALIQPGDEVIVEKPTYEPMLTIFEPLGAVIRRIERKPENKFLVDMNELKKTITAKTKLIVLATLHNPSGIRLPEEQLREIGKTAASVGAMVMVDEVYQDFLGETMPPAFLLGGNFITTSSLTKVYGLGGLRVGWIFAPEHLVKRCYEVNNNMGVNDPFPSDHLGYVLMKNGGAKLIAQRARERAKKHWVIAKEFLDSRDDLSIVTPDAGIICYPRFTGKVSSKAFAEHIQSKYNTVIGPGYFFEDDGGFRLGFGCEEDVLREGLVRLGQALNDFRKG